MEQINLDTNSTIKVINSKNENYTLYINYNTTSQCWYVDVVGDNFSVYGIKITAVPNALRQWKDKLGFGLCVVSEDGLDLYFYEDLITGRIKLYILDEDDLNYQEYVFEQI